MQSELSSVSAGFAPSNTVTSHWKSDDIALNGSNWSAVVLLHNGSTTAPGHGEVDTAGNGNRRGQYGQFSPSVTLLLAVLMTLLVCATVLGNALVILAFIVDRSLRTRGNFFFLNLAIADFLVGGFCIPVYIPYVMTGEWRFGRGMCQLWLVVDYTLCTASVFNIVLISFERFMSVTKVVSYRCQKGVTRSVVLRMLSVWLAAFLLYGPAIIGWEHAAGHRVVPEGECHAEFYFNWYFLMAASTFEFFTPFVTVTFFNVSIYMNIRQRTLKREDERAGNEGAGGDGERGGYEMEELRGGGGGGGGGAAGSSGGGVQRVFFVRSVEDEMQSVRISEAAVRRPARCFILPSAKVTVLVSHARRGSVAQPRQRGAGRALELPPLPVDEALAQCPPKVPPSSRFLPGELREHHHHHHHHHPPDAAAARCRLSKDKKVAKSLAVIVCVFGLCWAPYTLLMIIRAACRAQCVQHYLYEISFWMLWINSSINPVLYPLCHSSFRRAFGKLLCPTRFKIQPHYMEHKC